MTVAALNTLINASAQNLSQFKGLSAAYGILLGGTPSTAGYTALINQNNTTNFGAGGTTVFNDENVYINTINALYQGNPTAKATFDAIVGSAATIQDALTLVYNFVIPASARTEAGLNFFKGQATFFAARAAELGVAGTNGTALVAFASLTKIAVDNDIGGLGDTINDLRAAVANGTAAIPVDGTVFTPLETADGAQFDADDVAGGANQGQSFTLTTGVDNYPGTGGNDTITGVVDSTAGASTLTAADKVVGGAGSDTLNIVVAGTATATTNGADISGVETIAVRNTGTGAAALDASAVAGVTAVVADRGTGTLLVTNLATGAAIGVTGNGVVANGEVAFAYATATNAVTLNIADGTKMTADLTARAALGGTATGTATAATINSTGAANEVGRVDLANATLTSVIFNVATNLKGDFLSQATDQVGANGVVTLAGAAKEVEFTAALDNTIKSIDASGMTAGGLKATVGTGTEDIKGGAGVDTITLNTGVKTATFGAGNDVVTTAAVNTTTAGAISGGDGTDTLAVAAGTDVDSAAKRAVFTAFETLQNNTTAAIAADGFTGITSVVTNADGGGFTGLDATQAAAVTVKVDQTAVTYALKTATGTSDVLSVELKNATVTASADLAAATVTGFETLNVKSSSGAKDAGTVAAATAAANVVSFAAAANLGAITISGDYGVNLILDTTAKAVTVTSTQSGTADLRVEGEVIKGSSITTTANNDAIETALAAVAGVQGDFVTYNAGAGDDGISTSLTGLNNVNNAQASLKIEGGLGKDTLSFATADATFVDARFQFVTGIEEVTLTNTTSLSFASGGFFDANFKAAGVTLTTGNTADGATQTIDLSSFTGATKLVSTTAGDGASTADNVAITTGSGADNVTVTAASWVGAAGAAGSLSVTTGQGDDTISVTTGTLLAVTGTNAVTINAGAGADKITAVHDNAGSGLGNFTFVIADGDSLAASRDKITGFDLGTAAKFADTLDLQGTPTVTANTAGFNGTDAGAIKSHAITSGIVTFDDVDTFATALVINEASLNDALAYLAANITTAGDTVAFGYDSNSDGTADATIVFQQGASDTVVELVGVVATSINATNATTAGLVDLA